MDGFTDAKLLALVPPVAAVWGLAAVGPRREPDRRPATSRWLWAWAVLVVLVVGWAVITWSLDPRERYPTASSLIDEVDATQAARTLLFLVWLGIGVVIARR